MLSVPAAGALNAASKKGKNSPRKLLNPWWFYTLLPPTKEIPNTPQFFWGSFFLPHEGGGQVDGRLMDRRVQKKLNISIYVYVQKSRVNKKNKAKDRQALIYFRLRWRDDEGTCRAIHIKKSNRRRNSMHPSADHLKSIYNIYTTPVGPQNAYSENKTKQQQTKCCLPQCCTFKPPAFH